MTRIDFPTLVGLLKEAQRHVIAATDGKAPSADLHEAYWAIDAVIVQLEPAAREATLEYVTG